MRGDTTYPIWCRARGLHCPWFRGETRLSSVKGNLDQNTGTEQWLVVMLILSILTFGVPRRNQICMTAPVEARSHGKGIKREEGLRKGPCGTLVGGRPRRDQPNKVRPEPTTLLERRERTQDTWADLRCHSLGRGFPPGDQRPVEGPHLYAGRRRVRGRRCGPRFLGGLLRWWTEIPRVQKGGWTHAAGVE